MVPTNAHRDEWPHPLNTRGHCLSRRQSRQLSRRFAGVGVVIAAARLQEIAAGAPVSDAQLAEVDFAVVASELRHEQRVAKLARSKRRWRNWLVVAAMTLIMLGLLLCVVLLALSLSPHTTPFGA